jgi:hypothetical protein
VVAGAATASAGERVTPGTARQVAHLVDVSHQINQVSATVAAELPGSTTDTVYRLYPTTIVTEGNTNDRCDSATGCVFGDKNSHTVVVLYGDSHASMWMSSLVPYAKSHHWKVVLIYHPACPAIQLPSAYRYTYTSTDPDCAGFYADAMSAIAQLKPTLVLLGERTTQVYSEPGDVAFTSAQWQAALQGTITTIQASGARVAVIEDLVWFPQIPGQCLAAYPSAVQTNCAVANPNLADPGQQAAEQAAASATGSGFIATSQWFCTTTCSPVVGRYITHLDQGHMSATYGLYLGTVFGAAVAAQLEPR